MNLIISGGYFDVDKKIKKIDELNKIYNDPSFWNDSNNSDKVIKELNSLNSIVKPVMEIKNNIELLDCYFELLNTSNELYDEFESIYLDTLNKTKSLKTLTYFNGEYDNLNAIFEIHAGAGGTESCDWVVMLSRMYTKYFDKKGYTYQVLDEQVGEETGIKNITYLVKGTYAFGYLKNEKGVHRLVRLSPFDANNRRHTSFAAVDVTPEFEDDNKIEIKDSDIRVDVYRSTGAGGQGVNTTDSAVRITHIPTGIVVTCQNERSQIKNKETALKVLKSKLYQIKIKDSQDKINSMKSDHSGIVFGSQIRSYVLHPYSMIKDHRTGYETSNVNKVFDGYIDEFIESNLRGDVINETV